MRQYNDLTGQVFGRLTVLYRTEDRVSKSGAKTVTYHCKCSCGNERDVVATNLRRGSTQSCGCMHNELLSNRCTKRDEVSKKLYIVHRNMRRRCYDTKDGSYKRYGGRGIRVCDEWLGENGVENFIRWARENGYEFGLSIERTDNDGNYCPENCRWATVKEQNNNRSTNRLLTVNGITKTTSQWKDYLGLNSEWLYSYSVQERINYIRKKLEETA